MKSPSEILNRLNEIKADDFFGTETGDLIVYLPFDDARQFLKPDATREEWNAVQKSEDDAVRKEIVEYLPFALEKATGHRGLSASRSIAHFRAWAWLLDDRATLDLIDGGVYRPYGMPILKHLCTAYGVAFPADEEAQRMGNGKSCTPDCDSGC